MARDHRKGVKTPNKADLTFQRRVKAGNSAKKVKKNPRRGK